jgi:hypothetical protein
MLLGGIVGLVAGVVIGLWVVGGGNGLYVEWGPGGFKYWVVVAFGGVGVLVPGLWFYGKARKNGRAIVSGLTPLVDALESCYRVCGAYPQRLDELIPDYISEIPKPVTPLQIRYRAGPRSFTLFCESFLGGAYYISEDGTWSLGKVDQ